MPKVQPLSVSEAVTRTGKPKRTIIYAITSGKLPAQKLGGYNGPYLIAPKDLDRWIAEYPRSEATPA